MSTWTLIITTDSPREFKRIINHLAEYGERVGLEPEADYKAPRTLSLCGPRRALLGLHSLAAAEYETASIQLRPVTPEG
ncbi:hypothetical protein ACFPC0_10855 [Streptomyces andamanensis]|uniref:Uncharacterized protein n=1 Tax=Streptomyces andamanensis TaxID=1565035 RepID=A0ABV8TCN9_9ACTN